MARASKKPRPAGPQHPARGTAELSGLALLALAILLLHGDAVPRPFFADDYLFLEQVRGRGLFAALASPDPIGNFFRPVSRALYFWVVSRLFGETPAAFHLVNLGLLLAALAVLYGFVRRQLGALPAFLAVAFASLHYATDVPLRWASGSQDLLAVLFATLTVDLHARGRRAWAAVALALALLSKEVAALAAVVAIVASHEPGTRLRTTLARGWPLLAVTAAWVAALAALSASRTGGPRGLAFAPDLPLAALAHLAQVVLGLEFRLAGDRLGHWATVAIVPALLVAAGGFAIAVARRGGPAGPPAVARRRALAVGVVWTAAATLPLAPVMPIWSAYFYLWAVFGVAVLVAAAATALRPPLAVALVAALVFLSGNARRLDEFAIPNRPWTWQSHVNRRYVERALDVLAAHLRDMRSARPTLPPRSTVFFSNILASTGWQAANGPLLRWAYRDSSLRSYYLGQFTPEKAARGPFFFFRNVDGRLIDESDDPGALVGVAMTHLITGRDRLAAEILDMARPVAGNEKRHHYHRAWTLWSIADTVRAREALALAGVAPARALPAGARERVRAAGSVAERIAILRELREGAALEPWVHAELARALLETPGRNEGVIEAYAHRVLRPDDPAAWQLWALAQLSQRQHVAAAASLRRYLAMIAREGRKDPEAEEVLREMLRVTEGDLAARSLR